MKSTITVRLSPQLGKQLEKVSKEEHVAVSDIVRESLARYVSVLRFHELQKRAVKRARSQGVYTDEDVFKRLS